MRSVRAAIEKLTVSEMIDIQRMLEDSAGTTEFIGLMNDHAEQLGSSLHEREERDQCVELLSDGSRCDDVSLPGSYKTRCEWHAGAVA